MEEKKQAFIDQVILIDKPLNWTSFDVVKKVRYLLKIKKIGHAGTLDPLASGLLILCTGKKTKTIEQIQAQEKVYTGHFHIGYTTPSYDLETEPENEKSIEHITNEQIYAAAQKLSGIQQQTPPVYSAVKKDGKRAYEFARAGVDIQLKSKTIEVYEFEITAIDLPQVHFKIRCSKGTYIRTLAHDFGQLLEVGAYLASLRRTKIGNYSVDDAWTIDSLVNHIENETSK